MGERNSKGQFTSNNEASKGNKGKPKGATHEHHRFTEALIEVLGDDETPKDVKKALKNIRSDNDYLYLQSLKALNGMVAQNHTVNLKAKEIASKSPQVNPESLQDFVSENFYKLISGQNTTRLYFDMVSFLLNTRHTIFVGRGGKRGSKTYQGCKVFKDISYLKENENERFLITRVSRPALLAGAKTDLDNILRADGCLGDFVVTKPDGTFQYENKKTGCKIILKAYETGDKAIGHAYKYIIMDEAPLQPFQVFTELNDRCYGKVFLLFNPTDAESWVNQEIEIARKTAVGDVVVNISTYKDNPFLADRIVQNIEYQAERDANYHRVHVLGEYGITENLIYPNWERITETEFDRLDNAHLVFGVDWGYFPDPTAVVAIKYDSRYNNLYAKELGVFYKEDRYADKAFELIKDYCESQGISYKTPSVYCDHEPAQINILQDRGLFAEPAKKGAGSINDGIALVRKTNIHIVSNSETLCSEMTGYRNQETREGKILNKPIDADNHTLDAFRYAFASYYQDAGFIF